MFYWLLAVHCAVGKSPFLLPQLERTLLALASTPYDKMYSKSMFLYAAMSSLIPAKLHELFMVHKKLMRICAC